MERIATVLGSKGRQAVGHDFGSSDMTWMKTSSKISHVVIAGGADADIKHLIQNLSLAVPSSVKVHRIKRESI